MITFFIFILSALVIATMLVAKRIEEKRKKGIFLLKVISRGNERAIDLHRGALHHYSKSKEKIDFLIKKQLPLRTKSLWNKFQSFVKYSVKIYMRDMRNSRLLKRGDGISEFFKNISEIEKGGGEINEVYEEMRTAVTEVLKSAPTPIKLKTSKKRTPVIKRKKLTVVESD
ncbi:MAG: hypothetical protein AAB758_00045 [Patescibacteria group bacterium]